jgi:hypothetical protein
VVADQVRAFQFPTARRVNASILGKPAVQTQSMREQSTPSKSYSPLISDPLGLGSPESLRERMARTLSASLADTKMM